MRATALVPVLLGLCAVEVQAQSQVLVDAGVGQEGAWTVAPRLRSDFGPWRVELTGERNDYGFQGTGMSGYATGSWFQSLTGPLQLELTGNLQGQHKFGRRDATAALGGGRLHLAGHRSGAWLGASAGGNVLGRLTRYEIGAWRALGPVSVQVQAWQTGNRVAAAGIMPPLTDTLPTFPDTLTPQQPDNESESRQSDVRSTTDLALWGSWSLGRAEVKLSSGMRFGTLGLERATDGTRRRGDRVSSTWWSAEASYWMMERLGLVATVGQSPIDPSLGTTGESFLRVGFRGWLSGRRATGPAPMVSPTRSAAFRTRLNREGQIEFTLLAAQAGSVELMADFTGWTPVALERDGSWWRLVLAVPPGLHRVNVRYDGGAWTAPPGTRVVLDEFGQESGEIVIQGP